MAKVTGLKRRGKCFEITLLFYEKGSQKGRKDSPKLALRAGPPLARIKEMPTFRSVFMTSALLLVFQGFATPSLASLDPKLAAKFYQSPQSPFASGEINRRELEKTWVEDQDEFSYLVQNGKKQIWVKADWIATDLHLSTRVHSQKTGRIYRAVKTAGSHLLGEAEDKKSIEWLSLKDINPLPEDLGLALTLTSVQVRSQPSWKSDSMMTLPTQSRLKILKIEDTWAQVEFESVGKISGWVDLSNLLTKYDFASFAMTADQKWRPINYRSGSELITGQRGSEERIPISKVTGLLTRPDLGISLVAEDNKKLLLRQNLTILKIDAEKWSLSRLKDHGAVYWRRDASPVTISAMTNTLQLPEGLSTEELLKREITSASFHPKNPNIGLASSQGIYLTLDGKFWRKISQFKNQNHAVLIDPQSVIYIGEMRSFDLAKTFAPYLRWEILSQMIEQKNRRPSNQMRISQLSIPRPGILQMIVETDLGKLKVAARNTADTISKWDFN